jgi:hypothetical protein
MKAISTRYLGPTEQRRSQVKADDGEGNSITNAWDSSKSGVENHGQAALDLCKKMGWKGYLADGAVAGSVGTVWIFMDEE